VNRKHRRTAKSQDSRPNALGDVQGRFNEALRHHRAGRIDDAVAHYEGALTLKPDYAEARNNLGAALAAQGKIDDAVKHYERAIAVKPDYAEAHNNLGAALAARGRVDDAVAHYERAIAIKPDYADAHNNLGTALAGRGNLDRAIRHCERALAINPNHAEAHNTLGNVFKYQGKFDDAMAHYARAIAIKPTYAEPHYNRAGIKTFHPGDAEIEALEALANTSALSPHQAPQIHFALAKAFEDSRDYVRAFDHLRKGNDLKRRQIQYDELATVRLFQRIATVFDRGLFDRFQGEGDPSSVPIFVLGMPRSGSSLIEQILASHPQIHGGGELQDLEIATGTVLSFFVNPLPFPECIPHLDGATFRRIGQSLSCPPAGSGGW
jgi:tetratricopeptide (TPR) repeat protein